MSASSRSEFCKPCYVSCDGCAFVAIRIKRIFRGQDDSFPATYQWAADTEETDNKNARLTNCDKGFTGCGTTNSLNASLSALGGLFNKWLEEILGPTTTNPNFRPSLVKGSNCTSCDVDILVGVEACFTTVTIVYNQAGDICPPCETQVVVNPASVKITIGPFNSI